MARSLDPCGEHDEVLCSKCQRRVDTFKHDNMRLMDALDKDQKIIDEIIAERNTLRQKLADAEEVLKFYADPESYIRRSSDGWKRVDDVDDELIRNYNHPNKDWNGSVLVSGKRAREYFKRKEAK